MSFFEVSILIDALVGCWFDGYRLNGYWSGDCWLDDWWLDGWWYYIFLHDTTGRDVITFNVNSNYSKHTENKTNGFMGSCEGFSAVGDVEWKPEIKHKSNISRDNIKLCLTLHYSYNN